MTHLHPNPLDTSMTPDLQEVVHTLIGPFQPVAFTGHDHHQAFVWHVQGPHCGHAFVKLHAHTQKYRQESTFYTQWAPHLSTWTPSLLAHSPKHLITITSAAPGSMMQSQSWTHTQLLDIMRQAGAFTRDLLQLPFQDHDPVPLSTAYRKRADVWFQRARGLFPDTLLDQTRTLLHDQTPLDLFQRSICHRDFSPRNWAVDPSQTPPKLTVLDFGHARPDLWITDLLKLADDLWIHTPDTRKAWEEGFGRPLHDHEEACLHTLLRFHAICTIVWSTQHNDTAYEHHARTLARTLWPNAAELRS